MATGPASDTAPVHVPRGGGVVPARFAPVVFGFLLSGLMTTVVSGVATLRNVGLTDDFAARWFTAFGTGWPIAFPTVLLVAPIVRRLVGRLVASPAAGGR